jgi:hypothetical protein
MAPRKTTIGLAVDACIADATEEWFTEHAGLRSREVAAATDIKKVNAVIERFPAGKLQISVTVVAATIRATHNAFYRYQLQGTSGYVRVEARKPKG